MIALATSRQHILLPRIADRIIVSAVASTSTTKNDNDFHDSIITNTTTQNIVVDFPPPLTKLQRLQRATKFWTSVLPIVFSYYTKETELRLIESFAGQNTNFYNSTEVEHIWNEQHARGAQTLANTILSLKGFYVKTAQIIASRRDLFPVQYTDALSNFTDSVDPLPVELIKAVISKELLLRSETFEDVFATFDEIPLGSASVAQVHRAVLSSKFGNKEVAVKVQRPAIESKLMGDIVNLKALAKTFAKDLPLDYYTVFCELEKQLSYEFDFVAEAVAMDRIYGTINKDEFGRTVDSPSVVMPRPVSGLVSKRGKREFGRSIPKQQYLFLFSPHATLIFALTLSPFGHLCVTNYKVLVMDYLDGVPLSRAADEMSKRGISPDSPEAQLFGRKLLRSLTDVFGRCILETGFFHGE